MSDETGKKHPVLERLRAGITDDMKRHFESMESPLVLVNSTLRIRKKKGSIEFKTVLFEKPEYGIR